VSRRVERTCDLAPGVRNGVWTGICVAETTCKLEHETDKQ
jgi:hypothetical protein